ncbi:aminotransferase class I/II-fold pyridoxal phosphate-dependent enzyme [Pseudoalteromonas sp. JBTF-M23]|uniref:cysteine-S-conjugate beta-lyase n=2 Tax=Pseudoalteromonas caenipelagi TaxID=2726988 RepID=A0A849VF94_9GAMM|nr:aminotransferase class I/II-fold pyridoxal phosphate-dependent enzyme [Pseudoalteromonas caenipelagi]
MLEGIFGTADVTPFWVADMDLRVAEPIIDELQRLTSRGKFAYEFHSQGVFKAISDWNLRRHGLKLNTSNFVQVTGVLTGIALLIRELTEVNDSILIQTPAYHQFSKVISTANRKVVKSPLRVVDDSYEMDFQDLESKLKDPNVKVLILCNPHNPVGRVWRPDELITVLELANRYNVTIISDEIHSDIIYQGYKFTSLMTVGADKHVSLIGSPSKTFGLQSISNGYLYTENTELLEKMKAISESLYLDHGSAFSTFATIAAYEKGESWLGAFMEYMQGTVDWLQNFTDKELTNVKMFPVEGTYQAWLDFSGVGLPGDELIKLFGRAGFGASPGTWFDSDAKQYARISFACPRADIQEAFKRLDLELKAIT